MTLLYQEDLSTQGSEKDGRFGFQPSPVALALRLKLDLSNEISVGDGEKLERDEGLINTEVLRGANLRASNCTLTDKAWSFTEAPAHVESRLQHASSSDIVMDVSARKDWLRGKLALHSRDLERNDGMFAQPKVEWAWNEGSFVDRLRLCRHSVVEHGCSGLLGCWGHHCRPAGGNAHDLTFAFFGTGSMTNTKPFLSLLFQFKFWAQFPAKIILCILRFPYSSFPHRSQSFWECFVPLFFAQDSAVVHTSCRASFHAAISVPASHHLQALTTDCKRNIVRKGNESEEIRPRPTLNQEKVRSNHREYHVSLGLQFNWVTDIPHSPRDLFTAMVRQQKIPIPERCRTHRSTPGEGLHPSSTVWGDTACIYEWILSSFYLSLLTSIASASYHYQVATLRYLFHANAAFPQPITLLYFRSAINRRTYLSPSYLRKSSVMTHQYPAYKQLEIKFQVRPLIYFLLHLLCNLTARLITPRNFSMTGLLNLLVSHFPSLKSPRYLRGASSLSPDDVFSESFTDTETYLPSIDYEKVNKTPSTSLMPLIISSPSFRRHRGNMNSTYLSVTGLALTSACSTEEKPLSGERLVVNDLYDINWNERQKPGVSRKDLSRSKKARFRGLKLLHSIRVETTTSIPKSLRVQYRGLCSPSLTGKQFFGMRIANASLPLGGILPITQIFDPHCIHQLAHLKRSSSYRKLMILPDEFWPKLPLTIGIIAAERCDAMLADLVVDLADARVYMPERRIKGLKEFR
ncbi:uncharacterized protein BDR25DRAFT_350064 [Lindgomyces ingoldianus]|uniref:Uncharacterized protein n=1 Tax=Lindgomyces ingoldianus TaxID=673940 RepID=A0ACB6RAJ0_9PLEO|nr:uncharacterized protein BDR25DRAFT_350064 [Lindgomyces ingoldianus]KAF2475778.1 hypothetical protein BDR25DRAFT_350064 [Lindgomyces ingoldianus]